MVTERRDSHTSTANDDSPSQQQQPTSHALSSSPPQASETTPVNTVVNSTSIEIPSTEAAVSETVSEIILIINVALCTFFVAR